MRARSIGVGGALVAMAVGASCGADRLETPAERSEASLTSTPTALAPSPTAHRSVAALRERFRITPVHDGAASGPKPPPRAARKDDVSSVAVLGAGVAASFEATGTGSVRAVIPPEAKRAVPRAASVELPLRANAMVRIEDDVTHVSVGFAPRDAGDAELTVADGIARYAGALRGSDVVHRVHAEGTEDFVVLETRPAREELVYDVDVSRVAGLRLVSNTLEFLDEGGAPRLRVAPPYVVDASGKRSEARLAVEGCAYDTDASGPWGRAVTRAGAARCGVRVAWSGVGYPLIVDPSWTATGSMATKRGQHTATLLLSGKVLVAGGEDGAGVVLSSAELFDEGASFAATGAMATGRRYHAAARLPSGKVLVAGGNGAFGAFSSAELFDGSAAFAPTGSMATAREGPTATLLPSGKVLVAGGKGIFDALSSAELFDGSAAFALTGSMATVRRNHTATLLLSGQVLVAGGYGGGSHLSSAELFDGSASFALTGSMTTARDVHTATLLPSGKVLVAGGLATFNPWFLASAELFDGTASFVPTGSMTTTRGNHTATLLPSGKVLVVGGSNLAGGLASAELFALEATGTTCGVGGECLSGVCNERCCSATCAGTCKTCDAMGACLTVTNADDPDTCAKGLNGSSCDASGLCKKAQGQPCAQGADCVSGFCADGACCDTACGGACDACNVAAKVGACLPAPLGTPGSPACGNGFACDGSDISCPAACVSDDNCLAADYCSANGTCRPQALQGASCNTDAGADCLAGNCRECATGFCTDGVCCESTCNAPCQTCAAALKQQGADGTCGPALPDSDPHDDCKADPGFPASCKADGNCDGAGACRLYAHDTVPCGPTSCSGNQMSGLICDGAGVCAPSAAVDCGLYTCAGGACKQPCSADSDCVATAYCTAAKTCAARQDLGAACAVDDECKAGATCTDSVCCDTKCGGQCEACDLAGKRGSCSPVTGTPKHGTPCAGAGTTCGGTCDGARTATCTYAVAAVVCGSTCTSGLIINNACDGQGSCIPGVAKTCPGGFACAGSAECKTSCGADADCASNFTCAADHTCAQRIAGGTCDVDGHTVVDSGGARKDCAPFLCAGGACKTTCGSVDDCSSPNVCDASHHCTAPGASGSSGDSGGCAVAALPRESPPSRAPALLLAFGLAALASRRRRGGRA